MWPTTTRNRGKSGTPGRGNEIWEGLRPLSFFVRGAAPPPARGGPCSYSVPPRRPCRQAGPHGPPRRPGPGLSPLGVSLAAALWPSSGPKGMRRHENCPACPGRPPPGSGPRWLVVVGAWWCGTGPAVGRRRSAPVSFRRRPKRGGRSPPGQAQGSPGGRAWGHCGPPWPVPAWGAVIGWPGTPQRPGGRDGRGPLSGARAVVLFGLVPCRRRSGPRFSGRAGQRWKKAVRCPARGGSAAAAAGNGPGAKPPGKECGD